MSLTHNLSRRSGPLALPRLFSGLRILLLPFGVLGVVLFIAFIAFVAQILSARSHFIRGTGYIEAAVAVLHDPLRTRVTAERQALKTQVALARDEFAAARGDLGLWTPLLSHLGWIPHWGTQLTAADTATNSAFDASDAASHILEGLTPALEALKVPPERRTRLEQLTEMLGSSQPEFRTAETELRQAAAAAALLPDSLGNARLDAVTQRLRKELPVMRDAATWLSLAPDLLGAHRPATYLLVWQNPAELRATGGFIGASDFITVDRGQISHAFYGHDLPHQITWPPMPLPEEMYTAESNWLFEDSNWSPDFPLSARFERWFYGEDTGRWTNGVVDFLDTATPDLLRATGPVYLPSYGLWVNSDTVAPLAQRFINGHYAGPSTSGFRDAVRKQFFFAVLQALLSQAERLPMDRLPALGKVMQQMIARRTLQLYHMTPGVEAAIRGAHADGRLLPSTGDYLYVVDDNRSYNKLNPYVRESATYDITVQRSLWLDARLTLRYHVDHSPANLEGGGPNWGLWGTKHDYQDFVRVYVPRGAVLIHMTGLDAWKPQFAYGATQFAGRLLLQEDRSATVVIRYRLPPSVFSPRGPHQYDLKIQHQPGANLRAVQVVVRASRGVSLDGGTRVHAKRLSLSEDAGLTLRVGGVLRPPAKRVRVPSQASDPYIPFAYLRDPRHPL